MQHRPEFVLASASAARRALLRQAGIRATLCPADIDESWQDDPSPQVFAMRLAQRKAAAVADAHPDAWVLGADQVGFFPERPLDVFGKPDGLAAHVERLRSLRGTTHMLCTAFHLRGPDFEDGGVVHTALHGRRDLTDDELRAYANSGEGAGCAGGYAAEGRGVFLFERIEGCFFNVLGLPMPALLSVMRTRGWRFANG